MDDMIADREEKLCEKIVRCAIVTGHISAVILIDVSDMTVSQFL